ncbi:MAG: acyl-CoA synthetase [Gaiellaceae bacterium]
MTSQPWDWEAAARSLGAERDGRFNAGGVPMTHPSAVVWRGEDGRDDFVSGDTLQRRAGRIANVLRRGGVRQGDRVAGLMGRRPASFAVPLALWQLGAVYVPLFSGFRRDAIGVRLEDAGVRAVVTDPGNRSSLAGLEKDLTLFMVGDWPSVGRGRSSAGEIDLDREADEADELSGLVETRLNDPATIMYTSGTSGRPKGCVIPHRGIINLAPYVEHCLALAPDDLLFSTADTGWSFGLYTSGLTPLALGNSRLLYEGGFDAAEWWRAMEELGVTHVASAPTGFRQLAVKGTAAIDKMPTMLRAATAGGETLDTNSIDWFREEIGVTIYDSYGLTELGMLVANLRGPGAKKPAPGSMGFAVPGFDVQLVDDEGAPVGGEDEGQVAVRDDGWFLSSTYWGREEEWDARIRNGYWVTEDRARRDVEGRFWYVGRSDDVIVTAGYNVGPAEVEGVLLEHPAVAEAACVGEPDERKGHVIAAHVVLVEEAPEGLLDELRQMVGERVGWHAAPRTLREHTALPRTESGKVRRKALRELSS